MELKKTVLKALSNLVILVLVFFISLQVINSSIFDEDLKPEIIPMLESKPIKKIEPGNAFIGLWGLYANSDKDYYESGVQMMELIEKNRASGKRKPITTKEVRATVGFGEEMADRQWEKSHGRSCYMNTHNCLERRSKLSKTESIISPRLSVLLKRYSQILQMENYDNVIETNLLWRSPRFNIMRDLGYVTFSKSYSNWNNQKFLNQITRDTKFWKLLLNQNKNLYHNNAITHSLWINYKYLSEFIKNRTISEEQKLIIEKLLINLTKHETDFQRIFEMELITKIKHTNNAFLYRKRLYPNNLEGKLIRTLWQKNATLNDFYDNSNLSIKCLSELPVAEYFQFAKGYKSHCGLPKHVTIKYSAVDFYKNFHIYNFFGKHIAKIESKIDPNYLARLYDLIGIINLVKLQLELKSLSEGEIAEAIKKSTIKNHYTGEPMDYDQKKNEIFFKCLYTNRYREIYKLECNIKL